MWKRHRSGMLLKRHGSSVELLPHDVVELILERLPVKPLLRFRAVSKKWKTTIDSRRFQEKQLIRRRQSRGRDVLLVALGDGHGVLTRDARRFPQRIPVGSSLVCTVKLPTSNTIICNGSCDGLVCLYCTYEPSIVVNPATRWHQSFPLSNFQQLVIDGFDKEDYSLPNTSLGFGKDKFRSTYKPVWLYNSSEFGLDNVTTCEVFDFSTNAWRYVVPASPCRINACHSPVYLDGSLYWLTEGEEANVLFLDLHTETFQVIAKAPFSHVRDPRNDMLCILDDRLCVSEKNGDTQVIWSLDSSGANNNHTWKKLCSLDLSKTLSWFGEPHPLFPLEPIAVVPIAILDENKLLFGPHGLPSHPLGVYDLLANSFDVLFQPSRTVGRVCYFQSLFSTLSTN